MSKMAMREYENTLIREQTEGPMRWCSACERDADDCVCEELSDHFRDVDAAYAISAEASARSEPADFLGRVGQQIGGKAYASDGQTVNSGSDVCVPAESESHQAFSEWLEAHGDSLPLSQSFSAWLERSGDQI